MAAFAYVALDPKGRKRKGVLEGDTARQVRQSLREQALTPLEINSVVKAQADKQGKLATSRQKLSNSDLTLLTRQLATLVDAGMPLEEALQAVAQQSERNRTQSLVMAVRSRVLEGHTLADSLSQFPRTFDELYRAMVAAGEKSGNLGGVLARLADYTERRHEVRQKMIQAMVYPIVLTVVAIGVISILLAYVVPQVIDQFEHMGQSLPPTTQLLILLSDLTREFGPYLMIAFILLLVCAKLLLRKPSLKLRWHRVVQGMPLVGKVSRGYNSARFARTLSILHASGVPLLDCLRIAGEVITNHWMRHHVGDATERVREGSSLRAALGQRKLFPPMMLHMIASGEKSGELEQMLERSADNQDREFESVVNLALGVLQPLLVVMMASVVLFIVLAILQPILALNNLVGL